MRGIRKYQFEFAVNVARRKASRRRKPQRRPVLFPTRAPPFPVPVKRYCVNCHVVRMSVSQAWSSGSGRKADNLADEMHSYPVTPKVNKASFNEPDAILPVEPVIA